IAAEGPIGRSRSGSYWRMSHGTDATRAAGVGAVDSRVSGGRRRRPRRNGPAGPGKFAARRGIRCPEDVLGTTPATKLARDHLDRGGPPAIYRGDRFFTGTSDRRAGIDGPACAFRSGDAQLR